MKSVKREKQNPNMISFNQELGECSYRSPEGKILFNNVILLDSCGQCTHISRRKQHARRF